MNPTPDHDRTATLAYQIWEEEGRPEGRCEVHWQEAERQIRAECEASLDVRAAEQDFGDAGTASARNASAPMRDTRPTPVTRAPASAPANAQAH